MIPRNNVTPGLSPQLSLEGPDHPGQDPRDTGSGYLLHSVENIGMNIYSPNLSQGKDFLSFISQLGTE